MQPKAVVANLDEEFTDPSGHPLPPSIVMERGESLDIWSQRAAPDRSQAFTVRFYIPTPNAQGFHRAERKHLPVYRRTCSAFVAL